MRDYVQSQRWLAIALGALTLGGLLSFILVIGRVPFLSFLINDLEFVKRSLVVHVNLAIFVWLFATFAALYNLLPKENSTQKRFIETPLFAAAGVVVFTLSGFIPGVKPILSNYIPVLHSPWFIAGISLFAISLGVTFFQKQTFLWFRVSDDKQISIVPPSAQIAIKAAALIYLFALFIYGESFLFIEKDLAIGLHYELLFWGGGHLMQVANVLGMMAAWQILLFKILGYSPLKKDTATVLYAFIIGPLFAAPIITFYIRDWGFYTSSFTQLMRFGIFPSVSIIMIISISALIKEWKVKKLSLTNPALIGFLTSVTLTITGFILGAFIRASTTLIPAHYHASIGAVTVSYMAAAYILIHTFGFQFNSKKERVLSTLQPALFGFGQVVFALGFALAGLTRKVYGEEQIIRTSTEYFGMVMMGFGGLLAITGGVLFIWLTGKTWFIKKTVLFLQRGGLYGRHEQASNSEVNG